MKQVRIRRIGALLLVYAMLFSLCPATLAADGTPALSITAPGPTVTVHEPEGEVDLFGETASPMEATIARDYSQEVKITLTNPSGQGVNYYLTVDNPYDDLSMNFVGTGSSPDSPAFLAHGATAEATLAIFAQEAELNRYENIAITCHVMEQGYTSRTLNLAVTGEGMHLEQRVQALDTGDVEVTLTNTGAAVNSLKVVADEALAPYAFFPAPVTNYVLAENASVTFTVSPSGLTEAVSGHLLANGNGTTIEIPVTLIPPAPTPITGLELALADNPLKGAQADAGSLEIDDATAAMSYDISYGADGAGILPVSVSLSVQKTDQAPADDGSVDARINGVQMGATSVDGSSITFTFNHLMTVAEFEALAGTQAPTTQEAGLELLGEDDMSNLLVSYDITIDLNDPSLNADELAQQFNEAVEDSARLGYLNNLPDLPASIRDQYAATLQLSMLLELLNHDPDKYGAFRDRLAQEINKQYGGNVEDPLNVLEDTLDKLRDSLESKITRKYPEFKDPISEDNQNSIQEQAKEDEGGHYSTVTIEENGHQCTNRGAISSQFYIKDQYHLDGLSLLSSQTAEELGIRVFYTGRIVNEDSYVSFEPISYDLYVNGQKAGISTNSGLSELNIIELDSSLIRLGQVNTFTRDYDVNPGTHFVNTDNRFTVVYPEDLPLVFTDNTQVETALPDFDVYEKNIFVIDREGEYVDQPIAGWNTLRVSLSNRGAHGGYYQLTVQQGEQVLLQDTQYRYLSPFSAQTLNLDVNLAEGDNPITVTITDCSGRTKDPDLTNNTATINLQARSRQVPSFTALFPEGQVDNAATLALSASLENDADVKSVAFYVDGSLVHTLASTGSGSYSYSMSTPTPGSHTLRAVVTYYSGGPTSQATSTTEQSTSFTVVESSATSAWGMVHLPEGASPSYCTLFHAPSSTSAPNYIPSGIAASIQKAGEGSDDPWQLLVSNDANPTGHILVAYDSVNRALYAGTVGAKDSVIDLTARRTLTLTNGAVGSSTLDVYLPGFSEDYLIAVAKGGTTITLPPLALALSGSFTLTDVGGQSIRLSLEELDLRTQDQTVDLKRDVLLFSAALSNVPYVDSYYFYSYDSGSYTHYSSRYLSSYQDAANQILWLYGSDPGVSPLQEALGFSYSSSGENYLFFLDRADWIEQMDLTAAATSQVTIAMADGQSDQLRISDISLASEDWPMGMDKYCSSNGTYTFHTMPGTYRVTISYRYGDASYTFDETVTFQEGENHITLSAQQLTSSVQVLWPDDLGQSASLYLSKTNGGSFSFSDLENGDIVRVEPGSYYLSLTVSSTQSGNYSSYSYSFDRKTVADGQSLSLQVGNLFTGVLELVNYGSIPEWYFPGASVTLRIADLTDQYGNTLDYISSSEDGYVLFTSESGQSSYPVSLRNVTSSFTVPLPRAGGTYTLSFLSSLDQMGETVTIRASAGQGGSITPNGAVQVLKGGSQTFAITPASGYQIGSVLVDGVSQGAISTYTFTNVTEPHTISATFTGGSGGGGGTGGGASSSDDDEEPVVNPDNPAQEEEFHFTDVPKDSWFYEDVQAVCGSGLFAGTSDTTFSPLTTTTRAMFVTVLARLEHQCFGTEIRGQSTFSDVQPGQWYTDAIAWAADAGITSGVGDGAFGLLRDVTREQACTLAVRYLESVDYDLTSYRQACTFADRDTISPWALDAVGVAQALNLMVGRGEGYFDPGASMTRAECAAFFHRLANLLDQFDA